MIKKWLKLENKLKNVLIILRIKIKKPITKHVYENNTLIKTDRTPIIGISGSGKIFMMLSLLKYVIPDDV